MTKKKEHRKRKRFQVSEGPFVGIGPDFTKVGRVRDLSMDGLAFRYVGNRKPSSGSYVDIFLSESGFFLSNLPIKIISDIEVVEEPPFSSMTIRQCCVKFRKLTAYQSGRLKYFIENHTIGEA